MTHDNVTKIGGGGRLYSDAREKADAEAAPPPPPVADQGERIRDFIKPPEPPLSSRGPSKPTPVVQPKVIKPPKPPRDWRGVISTVVELLGIAVLSGGFWMLTPWLGIVILGMCLIIMGIGLGITGPIQWRRPRSP